MNENIYYIMMPKCMQKKYKHSLAKNKSDGSLNDLTRLLQEN